MTLTPEQIEASMMREEATDLWMAAFNAWCEHPLPANEHVAREAAAAVIQQAFAERDGEIERLTKALEFYADEWRYEYDPTCCWDTRGLSKARTAQLVKTGGDVIADNGETARQALAAKGDSRG